MSDAPPAFTLTGVSAAIDGHDILHGLNLTLPAGSITALIGPNGSGKSTLLRSLARQLALREGAVLLDGTPLTALSARALSRRVAMLPQNPQAPDGLLVRELVGYGRYPWQSALAPQSQRDREIIAEALAQTGLAGLADRPLGTLSGGQRQRAWIAMTLAQDTGILLLDEPTTFLDLSHQLEVLELLEKINRARGITVVMVVHDINHALRHADHVVALKAGRIAADGPIAQAVTPALIAEVFNVRANILTDAATGLRFCLPYGLVGAGETPAAG